MNKFIIQCDINTDLLHQMDALRTHHLNYIKSKSNVVYGGLMLDGKDHYKGICYIIKAEALSDAEDFIKQDPYWPIYHKYEITKFIQKIPNNT